MLVYLVVFLFFRSTEKLGKIKKYQGLGYFSELLKCLCVSFLFYFSVVQKNTVLFIPIPLFGNVGLDWKGSLIKRSNLFGLFAFDEGKITLTPAVPSPPFNNDAISRYLHSQRVVYTNSKSFGEAQHVMQNCVCK